MAALKITADVRTDSGKGVARKMREGGRVPAVLYGMGKDGVPLSLDDHELSLLLSSPGAKTSILELEVREGGKNNKKNVLIKEVQKHPYRDYILHMDLMEVALDQELSVMIPLEVIGTAQGVKMGGIMEMKRRELEIVCLPNAIPESLTVDVTDLEIGDSVHVEDLEVPEGVTIPHDVNFTLLTVVAAAVEPEPEEEGEEEMEAEEGAEKTPEKESEAEEGEEG